MGFSSSKGIQIDKESQNNGLEYNQEKDLKVKPEKNNKAVNAKIKKNETKNEPSKESENQNTKANETKNEPNKESKNQKTNENINKLNNATNIIEKYLPSKKSTKDLK